MFYGNNGVNELVTSFNVVKFEPNISLIVDSETIVYDFAEFNVSSYLNQEEGNISLYLNNNLLNTSNVSFNRTVELSSPGIYNIRLVYNETDNYNFRELSSVIALFNSTPRMNNLNPSNPNIFAQRKDIINFKTTLLWHVTRGFIKR
jgi:hypothetical protein